jgi:hypothetical protein
LLLDLWRTHCSKPLSKTLLPLSFFLFLRLSLLLFLEASALNLVGHESLLHLHGILFWLCGDWRR